MGLTNVRMRVRASETSAHSEEIDLLVDSGVLYTAGRSRAPMPAPRAANNKKAARRPLFYN